MTSEPRELTKEEVTAIRRLKSVAKIWPDTLTLYSFNSSLVVFTTEDFARVADGGDGIAFDDAIVDSVNGIPNDGGGGL